MADEIEDPEIVAALTMLRMWPLPPKDVIEYARHLKQQEPLARRWWLEAQIRARLIDLPTTGSATEREAQSK